jgi:photosystem II stability/assembly factor-like uncharacterized protein
MHFDPHHADVAFISYTDIGLHKSLNRGLSWRHSVRGVPERWRNTCYWLVFDHDVPGRIWSVWSAGHDYPRLKMFRRRGLGQVPGGVCVSDDDGETWRPTMEGMPECGTTHVLLDAASSPGGRILYVTAFGRGVYRSDDGGASWRVHNNGLGDNLHAWRLVGEPSRSVYLLVARDYRQGESAPGGVYCTSDGAVTWRRLDVSDEAPFPTDLCMAPDDPDVMYLSAWPIGLADGVAHGGILRSGDGGMTWERLPAPGEYVYALTIDPREPAVMYATMWHEGVFRSGDEGRSWERLEGANFGWPHRVISDPFDPNSVYLTTYGASVWHGPKLGAPDAPRDITNLPPVRAVDP